jgi:hypothetical protein
MIKGWDKAAQSTKRFIVLKVTGYHFPNIKNACHVSGFRGVAERLNAAVLKTVLLKGNGGSNPSSSAITNKNVSYSKIANYKPT